MSKERESSKDIPFLLSHLFESIGEIPAPNLLVILELRKFIPRVPRHVKQRIAHRITAQSFPPWYFTPSLSLSVKNLMGFSTATSYIL